MPTGWSLSRRGFRVVAGASVGIGALLATSGCSSLDAMVTVPAEYKSYFEVAAKRCPGVLTPEGLAGQAYAESKFTPDAISPAKARGMMQIIDDVWAVYGTDANGDGKADPYTAADSIATAAKFSCVLARGVNSIPGDKTRNRLAAYNAGLGAVRRYDGIPPYAETQRYVDRVQEFSQRFEGQFVKPTKSGSATQQSAAAS